MYIPIVAKNIYYNYLTYAYLINLISMLSDVLALARTKQTVVGA